jgi:hypothetical protein
MTKFHRGGYGTMTKDQGTLTSLYKSFSEPKEIMIYETTLVAYSHGIPEELILIVLL